MADELMSPIDYTPTTDVVRHALTFPRLRLGEPRHMTTEAVDRWLETVRQEERARLDVALAPARAWFDAALAELADESSTFQAWLKAGRATLGE